ncbi:serine protease [Roseiarcaceae bacterium H3SJ34-1]|uniref:S1 family peptidase n=1 Tax=Terripilifer ovatus TaxID=3032367 RepID=UPI003AB94282|nr:serine protease [Roseiarcaceae bacterium H3SJ34-1]
MQPLAKIDNYSFTAIPIEPLYDETKLAIGTAFFWLHQKQNFLITNWHNLSGRRTDDEKPIHSQAAIPNKLRIWCGHETVGNKISTDVDLYDKDGTPIWFVHPTRKHAVDIAAIAITPGYDVRIYAINDAQETPAIVGVGAEVFILGFPTGLTRGGFPIWKRGSIATEPDFAAQGDDYMLIDSATRAGMSGAPVIFRTNGTFTAQDGSINIAAGANTSFVGIYSGRLKTPTLDDPQLGITWPKKLIEEVVAGGVRDTAI